ncbi:MULTISPECIES: amidohydrolase family protein [unclassified Alishewanella]|uniref:amidohydrolase family protein n=1 Tax=unclassified Alishewanella TaxID=2628974 RepID=UPI0040416F05
MRLLLCGVMLGMLFGCSKPAPTSTSETPSEEHFTVMLNGNRVGHLHVMTAGSQISIDYDYKSNGRGPASKEILSLDAQGLPTAWQINGNTTFGNSISEQMQRSAEQVSWQDATGADQKTVPGMALYVPQNSSPYSAYIMAKALLDTPAKMLPALPAGQLSIEKLESLVVDNNGSELTVSTYALSGADLDPDYLVLDEQLRFFAFINPRFIVIREGFEAEEAQLRQRSANYSTQRFEAIQAEFAHRYDGVVRIRNVRVFQPEQLALSEPVSVLVKDGRIERIAPLEEATQPGETEITGNGGSLLPGLYDMHGHVGDDDGLMNVLAGVTSIRDMGNSLEVLGELIGKIDAGILAGPRISRYGMIEGKSPTNNNNGILVETEAQALAAVQTYADNGFPGIKIYNSMKGEWVPAMAELAKARGMRVSGHVPAFSNANAMIKAGYHELTHINQVMLGWVLQPDEDTRTLLRLTALDRLPALDLNSEPVQYTLQLMRDNNVAMEPTLAIHERLLLSRNGETQRAVLDYIDNMPPGVQRSAKVSMVQVTSPEQDAAYRGAYEQIVKTLTMMREKGIFIVPGTDLGGAFTLHRELELYQQLGFSPAELLKLASYDMAKYMGHTELGSIEAGKLADFFLVPNDPTVDFKAVKTISLVSRGGVFYYPSEVYPKLGIKPFTDKPAVRTVMVE